MLNVLIYSLLDVKDLKVGLTFITFNAKMLYSRVLMHQFQIKPFTDDQDKYLGFEVVRAIPSFVHSI